MTPTLPFAPQTPYYSDSLVTIYLGDCRELLPSIEADVIVTDPPYGMAFVAGRRNGKGGWTYESGLRCVDGCKKNRHKETPDEAR
jgi:DNA modification methylase